jgi:hypothetical protein
LVFLKRKKEMEEKKQATKATASAVENMKRAAKAMHKADGIKHGQALEIVAKAHGYVNWRAVTHAASLLAVIKDPCLRRPTLPSFIADVQREHPSWSAERVLSEAKHLCVEASRSGSASDAGPPVVGVSQHPHPPVGTPRDESLRGNSPPTLAPVAGRADWLNPVVGG